MKTFTAILVLLASMAMVHSASVKDSTRSTQDYDTTPAGFESVCNETANAPCFTASDFEYGACGRGEHRNHAYTTCDLLRLCCPCPQGTYQPSPNMCFSCVVCTNCTRKNLVELHACSITHNAVCEEEFPLTTPSPYNDESSTTTPPSTTVQTIPLPSNLQGETSSENADYSTSSEDVVCRIGYHRNHEGTECDANHPCCPCPLGTYQPSPSGCFCCLACTNCTKKNRVELDACNITHDAVCGEELPPTTPSQYNEGSLFSSEGSLTTAPPSTTDQTSSAFTTTMQPPAGKNRIQVAFEGWWIVLLICTHLLCVAIPSPVFICSKGIRSLWQKCRERKKTISREGKRAKKAQKRKAKKNSKTPSQGRDCVVPMLPTNSRNGTHPGNQGRAGGNRGGATL